MILKLWEVLAPSWFLNSLSRVRVIRALTRACTVCLQPSQATEAKKLGNSAPWLIMVITIVLNMQQTLFQALFLY